MCQLSDVDPVLKTCCWRSQRVHVGNSCVYIYINIYIYICVHVGVLQTDGQLH